ncbi:MAG: hypothetical protein ACRCSZ_08435 [Lactococcus lactis]
MKKAVIYFKGNVVTEVLFDSFFEYGKMRYFLIKEDEVACFPINYGYVVLKEITEEEKEEIKQYIKKQFTI